VTLQTGNRRVDLAANKPLHLDHAYATTAHSSQGLTCDRVLYNAESHSRTTTQDTYYVSISRERHSVKVFTNDETMLPKAVSTERIKGLALDLDRECGVKNEPNDLFLDAVL
jgi:ATP-dependent exoDNAse (exonuclease V) alpha subunit